MRGGEGKAVPPCRTTDLEHASRGHVGGGQTEEVSDCGELSGRGLGERIRYVGRRVVVGKKPVDTVVHIRSGIRAFTGRHHSITDAIDERKLDAGFPAGTSGNCVARR